MIFGAVLSAISSWLSYCLQLGLAYFLTWGACGLARDARLRSRIWGFFISIAVIYWIFLCVVGGNTSSLSLTDQLMRLPPHFALQAEFAVQQSSAPKVSWLAHRTWEIYFWTLALSIPHFTWKSLRLRFILRRAEQPTIVLAALFKSLCQQMEVRHCNLLLHAELHSPATTGWLRPQILLPSELVAHLEEGELTDVLRHELFHVRRGDYLWDRLASLACRIVFFHPAVWLAYRRLRHERELVCDLAVAGNRPDLRLRYAECMAKIAHWSIMAKGRPPNTIAFSPSGRSFSARVHAVLSEPSQQSHCSRVSRVAAVAAMGLLMCALPSVGLHLRWSDPGASFTKSAVNSRSRRRLPLRLRSRPRIGDALPEVAGTREAASAERSAANVPAELLAGANSVPLPVLVAAPRNSAPPSSNQPGSSGEGSSASAVWNEDSATSTSVSRLNLGRLAMEGAAAGVAIATGDEDEKRGKIGH